jgi:hypothetical protein
MNEAQTSNAMIVPVTKRQIALLVAQFLLGMEVNLMGSPNSQVGKIAGSVLLLGHVLVTLGLVINAGLLLRIANTPAVSRLARAGAGAVGGAFVFGIATMILPLSNVWSFCMAAAFISAFVMYGRLLLRVGNPLHDLPKI